MPSITSMQVALNSRFQERVDYYMKKAAIAVMSETSPEAERVSYSQSILSGQASVVEYAIGVMTNPTLHAAADPDAADQGIVDSDLEFAVNSVFNAYAGVVITA